MVNRSLKNAFLLLSVLLVCISLNGCLCQDYIYVQTKADMDSTVSYYKLYDFGIYIKCDMFEPNVNEWFTLEGFSLDINSIDEAFKNMGNNFYNSKHNKAKIPTVVRKALYALDDYEDRKEHWITVDRAFIHNGICYLSISYNVNWQTPYSLLKYDENNDKLKEIMEISNEQIIGLKI